MAEYIDVTGQRFGKLIVIGYDKERRLRICKCDCGNTCSTTLNHLKSGHTSSCGCYRHRQTYVDLVGKKYNRLTVVSYHGKLNGNHVQWNCLCDCGKTTVVLGYNLKAGAVKSCGCLGLGNNSIHGMTDTRLYHIWDNMKARCYRKNCKAYGSYGGRGITICDEWLSDNTAFLNWALNNGYADNLTIERDDVNKGYSPSNCRWIPREEQGRNTRSALGVEKATEIKLKLKSGMKINVIAKEYNIHPSTVGYIKSGKAYGYIKV